MKKGIYCIENILTGEKYIGSSINLTRRKREHFGKLRSGNHYNYYLQQDWNEKGEENFKFFILQEIEDNLEDLEKEWILKLDTIRNGYNRILNTESKIRGRKCPEETKEKLSKSLKDHFKIVTHHCKGIKLSEEEKAKRRLTRQFKIHKGRSIEVIKEGQLIGSYDSIIDCAKNLSLPKNRIQEVCARKKYGTNKQKLTYKGYIFNYITN